MTSQKPVALFSIFLSAPLPPGPPRPPAGGGPKPGMSLAEQLAAKKAQGMNKVEAGGQYNIGIELVIFILLNTFEFSSTFSVPFHTRRRGRRRRRSSPRPCGPSEDGHVSGDGRHEGQEEGCQGLTLLPLLHLVMHYIFLLLSIVSLLPIFLLLSIFSLISILPSHGSQSL